MSAYIMGLDLGQAQDYTAIGVVELVGQPGRVLPVPHEPEARPVGDQEDEPIVQPPYIYHLRHLRRYPLRSGYPEIVEDVTKLLQTPPLPGHVVLVVDQTGVGAPVIDLLRRRRVQGPLSVPFSVQGPYGDHAHWPARSLPAKPVAPITEAPKTITAPIFAVHITGGNVVNEDREANVWNVPKRDLVSTAAVLLQTSRLRIAEALPEAKILVDELLNFQVKITDAGRDTYGAWREGTHDDLVLAVALACWWGEKFGQPRGPLSVPFIWAGPYGDQNDDFWRRRRRITTQ